MSKLLYSTILGINELKEVEYCSSCMKYFKEVKNPAKITVHRYYPCTCKKYDFLIPEFEYLSHIWE